MSRLTFFCRKCGGVRRRPVVAKSSWPQCGGSKMLLLGTVYAEAATKMGRAERLEWVRHGMRVFRRAGRRWTAALTPAQLARSRDQLDAYDKHYPGTSRSAGWAPES